MTIGRVGQWIRALAFVTSLLALPDKAFSEDTSERIRANARFARSTDLYRDCVAVRSNRNGVVDLARAQEDWERSYQSVKSYFVRNNGEALRWGLGIEATLTNGKYSTRATVEDVVAVLNKGSVQVKDSPDPAYTFTSSPHKIIVTTGLIRHICNYLLPEDLFDSLIARAKAAALYPKRDESERQQALIFQEASQLTTRIVVSSIHYAGLKIFLLGHETSHLAFDQFSSVLVNAEGIAELCKGIQGIFFLETRADMVGLAAIKWVPVRAKIDSVIIGSGFSEKEIADMGRLAEFTSFNDLLTIIEKETSWQAAPDCALSYLQRRDILDRALRSLNQ